MSTTERTQIVQVGLPWYSQEGELNYNAMTLSEPTKVDKRKAFRIIRKWYKEEIGLDVCNNTLSIIWKNRHTTWAIDEITIGNHLQDLARQTYEETITESNTDSQEETSGETG